MPKWKRPATCEGCTHYETHFDVPACSLLGRALSRVEPVEPECTEEDWRRKVTSETNGYAQQVERWFWRIGIPLVALIIIWLVAKE